MTIHLHTSLKILNFTSHLSRRKFNLEVHRFQQNKNQRIKSPRSKLQKLSKRHLNRSARRSS
jgi:hypothetical protein